MGIATLPCPQCGVDVKMGLPGDATIKSVSSEPLEEPEAPRQKVRKNVCRNEHLFYVHFGY